jgi:protein phosphatase PTC7
MRCFLCLLTIITLFYEASSDSKADFVENEHRRSSNAALNPPLDYFGVGVQIGVGCKPKKQLHVEKANSANIVENCGEDAYYLSNHERTRLGTNYISFGVADGVGSWKRHGCNPSVFSKALCAGARRAFVQANDPPPPLALMKQSYKDVSKGGDKNAGAATAAFLVLNPLTGHLESANLGDSGYLIIRNGEVMFQSAAQYHAFNKPFQLSLHLSRMKKQGAKPLNHYSDACLNSHVVRPGDVIVVGSNGLFDNMFMDEIVSILNANLSGFYDKNPTYYDALQSLWTGHATDPAIHEDTLDKLQQVMADFSFHLTSVANIYAHDKSWETPFSKLAHKANHSHHGGKVDDITVVAVYVHADFTVWV